MPKNTPFDPDAAFKAIISKPAPAAEPAPAAKPVPAAKPAPIAKPAPAAEPAPVAKPVPAVKPAPADNEKRKLKGYYLTEEQIRAVKLKALDDKIDASTVVRNALEKYLSDYL